MSKYELTLTIVEGSVNRPAPTHWYYVETEIDGLLCDDGKTEVEKMTGGKVRWMKTLTRSFPTLQPAVPIVVNLTLYKKKSFRTGFRLIGTANFALSDLKGIINKPAITGKTPLSMINRFMSGYLVLQLQLRHDGLRISDDSSRLSSPSLFVFTEISNDPDTLHKEAPEIPNSTSKPGPATGLSQIQATTTPKTEPPKKESKLFLPVVLSLLVVISACAIFQMIRKVYSN